MEGDLRFCTHEKPAIYPIVNNEYLVGKCIKVKCIFIFIILFDRRTYLIFQSLTTGNYIKDLINVICHMYTGYGLLLIDTF